MCVSCGSIGVDKEGQLISCSQCGQSYHPYCAGYTKMVCVRRWCMNIIATSSSDF